MMKELSPAKCSIKSNKREHAAAIAAILVAFGSPVLGVFNHLDGIFAWVLIVAVIIILIRNL